MPVVAAAAISAGAALYGHQKQSSATKRAAQLESDASRRALAFQQAQLDESKRQHDTTEAKNYEIYKDETAYSRGQDALLLERQRRMDALTERRNAFDEGQVLARQQRMQPYQELGLAGIARLGQPIPGPGSLAELMKRGRR